MNKEEIKIKFLGLVYMVLTLCAFIAFTYAINWVGDKAQYQTKCWKKQDVQGHVEVRKGDIITMSAAIKQIPINCDNFIEND